MCGTDANTDDNTAAAVAATAVDGVVIVVVVVAVQFDRSNTTIYVCVREWMRDRLICIQKQSIFARASQHYSRAMCLVGMRLLL